jgi:hypothetical protein
MLLANIRGQQQTLVGKFRVKFQQRQHPTFETARQGLLIFWYAVDVDWRSP